MDWRDGLKRGVMVLTVFGVVWLLCNPLVWIVWGLTILKILGLVLLASIMSRIMFKKSLMDLFLGDKDKDQK